MTASPSRDATVKLASIVVAIGLLFWAVTAFFDSGAEAGKNLSPTQGPGIGSPDPGHGLVDVAHPVGRMGDAAHARVTAAVEPAPAPLPEAAVADDSHPAMEARFLGRLVDLRDGAPIPFGKFRWVDMKGAETLNTDAEGNFETGRAYPSGGYWVGSIESGYDDAVKVEHRVMEGEWEASAVRPRIDVRIPIGPTIPLDIDIPAGLTADDLRATIARPDNYPYFDPFHRDWATLRPGTPPWARLGDNAVEFVGDVGPWFLVVGSLDGAWLGKCDLPAARGRLADPLRVELRPAASLRGTAIRKDGSPASNVRLMLAPIDDTEGDRANYRTRTDATGSFVFRYPSPGAYELRTDAREVWECAPLPLTMAPGARASDVTLIVRPRVGTGSVSGRVTSDTGTFHGPVRLMIGGGGTVETVWTEQEGTWVGSYTVEEVPPGQHQPYITTHPYFLRHTLSRPKASPPCTDFDIVIHDDVELFDLQVVPVDALTGLPIKEFQLQFQRSFGPHVNYRTSHVTRPSITGFPEGEDVEWVLAADGYVAAYGDQNDLPREGELRELRVPLCAGWGLRARTWDVDSREAVPGVKVYTDGSLAGTSGPDGHLFLEGAARPEKLTIEHPDWRVSTGWGVDRETGRFTEEMDLPDLGIALERKPK